MDRELERDRDRARDRARDRERDRGRERDREREDRPRRRMVDLSAPLPPAGAAPRRFHEGEVVRYGAGESWRPFPRAGGAPERERSPVRRPRSPRERTRSPPRWRGSPQPPPLSDSYVPPRRRSRTPPGRHWRERSPPPREQNPQAWRPLRSPLSRRPSPARLSPARLSPARWERERDRRRETDWNQDRDRDRDNEREKDRSERLRARRGVVPVPAPSLDAKSYGRPPPPLPRVDRELLPPASRPLAAHFRPSRSPERRPDHDMGPYANRSHSPPRPRSSGAGMASALTSRTQSGRSSPHPASFNRQVSGPQPHRAPPLRESSKPSVAHEPGPFPFHANTSPLQPSSSLQRPPPTGPASLCDPPTEPLASPAASAMRGISQQASHAAVDAPNLPPSSSSRPTNTNVNARGNSTHPPPGPRAHTSTPVRDRTHPTRSGRISRGRQSSRHGKALGGATSTGASGTQTGTPSGPRATSSTQSPAVATTFHPPTGPAAQQSSGGPLPQQQQQQQPREPLPPQSQHRPLLLQSLLAKLPALVAGGRIDAAMAAAMEGVVREAEPHMRKLREEEEKLRDEVEARHERLRKVLAGWDRLERESKLCELRSDLSEKSMMNLAGEGLGGAF